MARIRRVVVPAVVGVALVAMTGTGALAQNQEMRELFMRLERVQRELTTLQRHVYQGAPPPVSPSGATIQVPGGAAEAQATARLEVRLTQLESELRDITGRIEENQHAIRQIDERLKKLVTDVDYRLAALEKRAPGPSAEAGEPEAPAQAAETARAGTAQGEAGSNAPQAIPPRSLGEISRSALNEGRPDPAAETAAAAAAAAAAGAVGADKAAGADAPASADAADAKEGPEKQYALAIDLLQAQKFSEAERALRGFIDAYPEHALQDNAHYWLGESYYARKDYQRAAYAFADGFQKFPEGGKAADSLLKLGMSLGRLGKATEACTAFSRLMEHFPDVNSTLKSRVSREQRTYGCN